MSIRGSFVEDPQLSLTAIVDLHMLMLETSRGKGEPNGEISSLEHLLMKREFLKMTSLGIIVFSKT